MDASKQRELEKVFLVSSHCRPAIRGVTQSDHRTATGFGPFNLPTCGLLYNAGSGYGFLIPPELTHTYRYKCNRTCIHSRHMHIASHRLMLNCIFRVIW